MSADLRLVVFDVDGTLVNSQAHILVSMRHALADFGLDTPSDQAILHGIGLSLPELMAQLVPETDDTTRAKLVARYKELSFARHATAGSDAESPFYPGMRDVLDQLRGQDEVLLATATGKSRRGMDRMISHHGLNGYFQSTQVADNHPSKPHPSMLWTALAETGVDAENAIMIGDTSYDMAMGKAAGMKTIGVGWGYHGSAQLDADTVVQSANELWIALDEWMEAAT